MGSFVIVRSYEAGVFIGAVVYIKDCDNGHQRVTLNNARRLWKWVARDGVALSGVAVYGLKLSESKIDSETNGHVISGVIEVIPASEACRESIYGK